jgi:hypothetical protein
MSRKVEQVATMSRVGLHAAYYQPKRSKKYYRMRKLRASRTGGRR